MIELTVVKIGGSLLEWIGLRTVLTRYLSEHTSRRRLLIAGGGLAADAVRGLDRAHGLSPATAHDLALRAMEMNAHAVAEWAGNLALVDDPTHWLALPVECRDAVLNPRTWLEFDERTHGEPLPRSWEVTSDSIAARVASRFDADLELWKSATPNGVVTRAVVAQIGLVDPYFETAARDVGRVFIVNPRDHDARAIELN